jgi:hypothetical protein
VRTPRDQAKRWAGKELDKLCAVIWRIGQPCNLEMEMVATAAGEAVSLQGDSGGGGGGCGGGCTPAAESVVVVVVESRSVSFGDLFEEYR